MGPPWLARNQAALSPYRFRAVLEYLKSRDLRRRARDGVGQFVAYGSQGVFAVLDLRHAMLDFVCDDLHRRVRRHRWLRGTPNATSDQLHTVGLRLCMAQRPRFSS